MAGMFPNAVARPSRERLPANSASTIPAKSSLPARLASPAAPPMDSSTRLSRSPPAAFPVLLKALRVGVRCSAGYV